MCKVLTICSFSGCLVGSACFCWKKPPNKHKKYCTKNFIKVIIFYLEAAVKQWALFSPKAENRPSLLCSICSSSGDLHWTHCSGEEKLYRSLLCKTVNSMRCPILSSKGLGQIHWSNCRCSLTERSRPVLQSRKWARSHYDSSQSLQREEISFRILSLTERK